MTRATSDSERAPLDGWTIAAIAVVVYILSNLAHEGAGHGGACLLAGGRAQMLNAVFFECDEARMSAAGVRWLAAAGTLANLLLAALGWIALRRGDHLRPDVRFGLVLLLAVNLLQALGYLLFSGIGRVGDWAVVFGGLKPEWVWSRAAGAGGAGPEIDAPAVSRRWNGLLARRSAQSTRVAARPDFGRSRVTGRDIASGLVPAALGKEAGRHPTP
jgi:hypothetical protein